jgi:hypothetical protein
MLTRQIMRSMTDDELERAIYAEFDARTAADVVDELRERFTRLVGNDRMLKAMSDYEFTAEDIRAYGEAMIEGPHTTITILEAINDAEITSADEMRRALSRAREFRTMVEETEETTTPSATVRRYTMLEQVIADNTAAIRELIATIKAGAPATPAAAPVVEEATSNAKATVAKKATSNVKATVTENNGASSTPGAPFHPAEAAAQEKPAAEEAPPATSVAESVTYEQVKHAILKVASTKSREIAAGILAEFGATKGPDLKPEQYAGIMARLNAVLSN